MSRFFAKLVTSRGQWAVNLLEFEGPIMTQRVTCCGEQSTPFTDLRYNRTTKRLSFRVNGSIDNFVMHEIDEELGRKLIEPHNWTNLQHGLKIKSQKTLDWLIQKGIKPEND